MYGMEEWASMGGGMVAILLGLILWPLLAWVNDRRSQD